jgi:hypothetical protein
VPSYLWKRKTEKRNKNEKNMPFRQNVVVAATAATHTRLLATAATRIS